MTAWFDFLCCMWVYPSNSGFPDCDVSLSVKVVLMKTKDFEHMGRKNEAR